MRRCEFVPERDGVDAADAGLVHLVDGGEDLLMGLAVEVPRLHDRQHVVDRLAGDHQAPQHAPLGLQILRRQSIGTIGPFRFRRIRGSRH